MEGNEPRDKGRVLFSRNANPVRGESRLGVAGQLAVALVLLSMGLLYAIFIGASIDFSRKVLEISVAATELFFVSAIVGKLLLADRPSPWRNERFVPFMVWTAICSGLSAVLFVGLTLLIHRSGRSVEFWQAWAGRILVVSLVVHASGALALAPLGLLRSRFAHLDLEKSASVALVLIFSSLVLNFHVEPTNPWFNPLLQFVLAPAFHQAPALGVISAIVTVAAVLAVARYEQAPFLASYPAAVYFRKAGLPVVIAAMAIFYFDFRLPADPMHYLTNASPAMRLLHGGIPLVDTFSQYGPGPMIATSAAFAALPPTLGTASMLVQCFNLLFFTVLLVSLSRLTSARIASAILGSAIISVLLGCWGSGYSNLAAAPSNMGFRYLWPATMVLAISLLPSSRTWSGWTAAASAISAVWSIEAFVASVVIHLGFVVTVRIAQRKRHLLLRELPIAMLPSIVALSAFSVLIALWSGRLPDFGTYLRFLGVYNAFSDYWGIVAVNTFWGWIPVLILLSLIGSLVWKLLLARTTGFGDKADRDILYGYLPMATLAAFITLYYLGRSVDNVLLLALLPLSCLTVAPYLSATANWRRWGPSAWTGFGLITFSIFWGLSCGYVYLYRPNSPYHMAFHECRYDGHCSVSDLISTLGRAVEKNEPAIGTISYIGPDGEKMIDEAVSLIRANFRDEHASVFLGTFQGRSLATDLALLQAGKSSRWPISYTFTDEMLPRLAESISAAPIELKDGEPVIVRRDETALGPLEREILRRLRDRVRLCAREVGVFAVVYVVSQNQDCERN
jgi:hypothetical protein